ncbi:hypothetical protein [Bacillus massiliigorillae]|uniref:hypothetical protein n=1 Tax=Bacillus massiliigorillae TaxID=1243664 RepID=UPI00039ECEAF|nr:hypothetical protein [Bacillus massiliigorillae]
MQELKHQIDELFKDFPDSEETKVKKQAFEANCKELLANQMKKEKRNYMKKIHFGYSVCGSVLIISFFLFINMYYSPSVIWFVYPTFAVLWWPLTIYFYVHKNKN